MKKSLEQISLPVKKAWRPFDEARVFVRSLNLRGQEEWEEYRKSGERPDDIPSHPDRTYKNDGWKDWIDWLGNENRVPWNKGEKHPLYGKSPSEEHRRKSSEFQNRPEVKRKKLCRQSKTEIPSKRYKA